MQHHSIHAASGWTQLTRENRTGNPVTVTKPWTPSHSQARSMPRTACFAPHSTTQDCGSSVVRQTRRSRYGVRTTTRRPRLTQLIGSRPCRGGGSESRASAVSERVDKWPVIGMLSRIRAIMNISGTGNLRCKERTPSVLHVCRSRLTRELALVYCDSYNEPLYLDHISLDQGSSGRSILIRYASVGTETT